MPEQHKPTRVAVIGTGFVGSSIAYAAMIQGVASEIVLIDVNQKKAEGEALDLVHGLSLLEPMKIWAGDYDDCRDADVVVVTAGLAQKPGQSRLELASTNAAIMSGIIGEITKRTKSAVILIVSNPMDIMTQVAIKRAHLPAGQVFGSGTVLDSSRFRYFLSELFGVSARSVHGYVVGEHGDSEVALLSHTNISGEAVRKLKGYDPAKVQRAFERTAGAAQEIIEKKGATYYAIAIAVVQIVNAILRDANLVLPVSTLFTGQYGIKDVCLAFPSVVGKTGVKRMLNLDITKEERSKLRASASALKKVFKGIKPPQPKPKPKKPSNVVKYV